MEPENWGDKAARILVVPELIKELAMPAFKKAGIALGDAIEFSLFLTKFMRHGSELIEARLKNNLDKFNKKLESIPDEDIAKIPSEIAVPIVEKLTYVQNESIADLFIQLLTTAANKHTAGDAHPAFVQMIERTSADEAKIINSLALKSELLYMTIRRYASYTNKDIYFEIQRYLTELDRLNLFFPDNITSYLSNFIGMGILIDRAPLHKTDLAMYERIEVIHESYINIQTAYLKRTKPSYSFEAKPAFFEISAFGKLFICACTGTRFPRLSSNGGVEE